MCPGKWVHIKVIKMKKLFLNLEVIDGYPPVSMESIWAEVTEEGYFKINNIPFYSKEVSFGDIVSVIQTEENYLLYDKTIIHSKNSTLRIVFFNENQKFKDKILILEEMNATIDSEERNLNTLKISGVFEELKGLIFGKPEVYGDRNSNLEYIDIIKSLNPIPSRGYNTGKIRKIITDFSY